MASVNSIVTASCGSVSKRRCRSTRDGGFTLVELLLALAVMTFLAAASLTNYTAAGRRAEFVEGTNRFATLLRALRCQAQTDGRCMRLEFEPETYERGAAFIVSAETKPILAPGVFVPQSEGAWRKYFRTGVDVSPLVLSCELTGDDAFVAIAMGLDIESHGFPLQPVTFRPDGSCDSAEFILGSPHAKVTSGVKLVLDGVLGDITTLRLSKDTMEQYR